MTRITESQEAYFEHLAPGVFHSGHMAMFEEYDAGDTTINLDGKEIGNIALGGTKSCLVELTENPDTLSRSILLIRV